MTFIEIDNYIYNSITSEDIIENEIEKELLENSEEHDCHLSPEDGCNCTNI